MAVPKLDELHRPVLEIANASAQRLARREFLDRLIGMFSLTDADLQEMVSSGQADPDGEPYRLGYDQP